jgi:uncharacterized protein (DUF1697 family)
VAAIATYEPFSKAAVDRSSAFVAGFLRDPLDTSSKKKFMALRTDVDDFHMHDREIYWLCRRRQSESTFSNAVFEKAIGVRTTFRGVNTVRKAAATWPG